MLGPPAEGLIATSARHSRALPAEQVAAAADGLPVEVSSNVQEALALARARAARDDLICVTGSLFLVGEALQAAAESGRLGA